MRKLLVLTAVVALAAANPRERRQAAVEAAPAEYTTCRDGAGVCVPYYECHDDPTNTDGSGIFDIRFGDQPECPSLLDTCCSNPETSTTDRITDTSKYTSTCGKRNRLNSDVRIQGSQGAEFPWMTAVFKKKVVEGNEINLYFCGGSLIHPSIVLTAAHCVFQHSAVPGDLRVRLGEWDTQNEFEPYKHQDSEVYEVSIHPGFNPTNLHNDYALIYLSTPVNLSRNVDVICLDENPSILDPSHNCVVSGWGKDGFGKKGIFQNVLKVVDVPYIDSNRCQEALRTTRLGRLFQTDPSFLCAGGEEGKDSCTGDGGSPLVCLDSTKTQYVQVGIVSWGIGCGTGGIPGVYANIIYGYNWIVKEADRLLLSGGPGGKPVIDYWNYS